METFLIYIGKAALAAAAFYLLYLALFQHQKHFTFNRIYLPVSLALSFLIPLVTFTSIRYIEATSIESDSSFAYLAESSQPVVVPASQLQWFHYTVGIYLLGIAGFLFYLVLGHAKAISIIQKSRLQKLFKVKVNITLKDVHPFSFFNKIVLSEKTLKNPDLAMIVQHEEIHVKGKHTLDILFAEILFLFQWFNPFAWLLKDAIKNNLEYLTDHELTRTNDAQQYQLAMVGLAHKQGVAPFLTALNGSQLKNRIIMMKKKTENKYAFLKQLVVLPLLAILVMGLSNKEVKTQIVLPKEKTDIVVDKKILSDKEAQKPEEKNFEPTTVLVGEEAVNKYEDASKDASVINLNTGQPSNTKVYSNNSKKEITVSGKITDQKGNPVSGAAVLVKGTTIGTISDMDGNYQLNLEDEKATLVFMMVGFEKKEKDVDGKTQLDIKLAQEEKTKSKEIKVPGYADQISASGNNKYKVSGKVTNEKGDPVPGTAILIKGKTIGTVSDMNGNYEIDCEVPIETLVYSMVGHETIERKVGKDTEIDIRLKTENKDGNREIKIRPADTSGNTSVRIRSTGDQSNEPLYVVDGKVKSNIDDLDPETIESMDVLKGESAAKYYGEKAKNGAVIIITKKDNTVEKSDPLVIIDGEKSTKSINDLNPEDIASMSVFKDGPAVEKYGNEGKNGVIVILTKNNKNEVKAEPLVIIDGEKSTKSINDLKPEDIASMSVFKDGPEVEKYGDEAKDGVIMITTNDYKVSSELDLRKFFARNIKYPFSAQENNKKGVVKIAVQIDEKGLVKEVFDDIPKNAIPIGEIVATALKLDSPKGDGLKHADKVFEKEVKRIIAMLPVLDIPELKGKDVVFTVKFELQ